MSRNRTADTVVNKKHGKLDKNTGDVAGVSAVLSGKNTFTAYLPLIRRSLIFLLVMLWFGAFAPLGVDFHHDGVMMLPALKVVAGKMVFRDVFCQYGFLSPLLQAIPLKAGGGELLAMKYFSVLFYAGIAVLLDIIWARLLAARWRDLILLMYCTLMPDTIVTFHPWSSIFALFFSLAALYFLIKHFEENRWYWTFAAGVCAMLTFLSRQPVGVVTVIALAGTLFLEAIFLPEKEKFKYFFHRIAMFAAGLLLPGLSAAAVLLIYGAWDDYIFQCYTYVFNFVSQRGGGGEGGSWNYLAESLFPFVTSMGFYDIIFAILPLPALYWFYRGVRDAGHEKEQIKEHLILLATVIFALGAWHQYYPVPCVRHLFWGGVPFFGIFVYTLRKLWFAEKSRRMAARLLAAVLVLAMIYCAGIRVQLGIRRLSGASRRQVCRIPGLKDMRLLKYEADVINGLRGAFAVLPPEIRSRGVINHTEDGLWSIILPDAGFSHPQFLRMKTPLYPDYESGMQEFIRQHRPVVLSDIAMALPEAEYTLMFPPQENKILGRTFYFYIPRY